MAPRWFRFGKKQEEEAAAREAEALTAEVETPPEAQAPGPAEAQDAPEGPRKRRRRGSRGGRGKKKPGVAPAAGEVVEETDEASSGSASSERVGPERKSERRTDRKTDKRQPRSSSSGDDGRRRSVRPCPPQSASCSSRSMWASSASRSSKTTVSPRCIWNGPSAAPSPGTSTSVSSTTSSRAWRPRSSRSASRRTDFSMWTRLSARSSKVERERGRSKT